MVGPTPDKADQHLMDCWRAFGQRRRSSLVHQTSLLTGKTPTTTCTTCQSNATSDNNRILFFPCHLLIQINLELTIGILVIVFMHCVQHCSVCDRWIASQHLKQPSTKTSDWFSVRIFSFSAHKRRWDYWTALDIHDRYYSEVEAVKPVYMIICIHRIGNWRGG